MQSNPFPEWGVYGVIITVLAGVIVFLYKELKAERKRNDDLQDLRLTETKESRDKIVEPMEEQTKLSEKIYDLLLNSKRGR